jgi:uncharacterized protein (DUF427 family)
VASYYSVAVDRAINPDSAWNRPEPKVAARSIAGRIAFWRAVTVAA